MRRATSGRGVDVIIDHVGGAMLAGNIEVLALAGRLVSVGRTGTWVGECNLDEVARSGARRTRLNEIKGMVPSLFDLPQGCSFALRCGKATDRCREAAPPLEEPLVGGQ